MDIPLDEVIHFEGIASSSTGAAVDADSTPTFAVYEESTDTDIGVGGNMTKRTGLTGDYRGSFTASAANGFELGKWYHVIGSATIGGIACKGVLARFRIVASEAVAGFPQIDVKKFGGTDGTFSDGRPEVNTTHVGGTSQTPRDLGFALPDAAPNTEFGLPVVDLNGRVAADLEAINGGDDDIEAVAEWAAGIDAVSGAAPANLVEIGGDAQSATDLKDFADDGYDPSTNKVQGVVLTDTATNLTNAATNGDLTATMKASVNTEADAALSDVGVTLARMGALTDWIDGGRLDLLLDAVKAKTDGLPSDPADASDIATAFGIVNTTLATIAGYLDTEIAAIKAKTDNLPASPAATSDCLTQADVRTAVGLASANLDTQIGLLATAAKLLKYFQLALRKDAAIATDNATELTAINASGGSGAGGYLNTSDSQEALRDNYTTGGDTIIISPVQSTIADGDMVTEGRQITDYQHRRFGPHTFIIVDANNDPVDCSGDNLSFVAFDPLGDGSEQYFQILQSVTGITVANQNEITVEHEPDADITGTARDYAWILTDMTTGLVRAKNDNPLKLSRIKVAADEVAP